MCGCVCVWVCVGVCVCGCCSCWGEVPTYQIVCLIEDQHRTIQINSKGTADSGVNQVIVGGECDVGSVLLFAREIIRTHLVLSRPLDPVVISECECCGGECEGVLTNLRYRQ